MPRRSHRAKQAQPKQNQRRVELQNQLKSDMKDTSWQTGIFADLVGFEQAINHLNKIGNDVDRSLIDEATRMLKLERDCQTVMAMLNAARVTPLTPVTAKSLEDEMNLLNNAIKDVSEYQRTPQQRKIWQTVKQAEKELAGFQAEKTLAEHDKAYQTAEQTGELPEDDAAARYVVQVLIRNHRDLLKWLNEAQVKLLEKARHRFDDSIDGLYSTLRRHKWVGFAARSVEISKSRTLSEKEETELNIGMQYIENHPDLHGRPVTENWSRVGQVWKSGESLYNELKARKQAAEEARKAAEQAQQAAEAKVAEEARKAAEQAQQAAANAPKPAEQSAVANSPKPVVEAAKEEPKAAMSPANSGGAPKKPTNIKKGIGLIAAGSVIMLATLTALAPELATLIAANPVVGGLIIGAVLLVGAVGVAIGAAAVAMEAKTIHGALARKSLLASSKPQHNAEPVQGARVTE